jgi:plasmid stabilization system protein ParE
MKRFRIEFTDTARAEIDESFEWGIREWGSAAARRWFQNLRAQTRTVLAHFPLSQPIAPESIDLNREIRQMIFGRYRVLFEIEGRRVRVLHIRGSFVAKDGDQ